MMRYPTVFIGLVALLLLTTGCTNRQVIEVGPKGQEAVHQATADLSEVAHFLRLTAPWLSSLLEAYSQTIEQAVPLAAEVEQSIAPVQPQVSTETLQQAAADPDGYGKTLASAVETQQAAVNSEVAAEQEELAKPWYVRIFSLEGAGWLMTSLVGVLKIASLLGLPGARAAESTIISLISSGVLKDKVAPLERGLAEANRLAATASNLVESSEVGRWGLKLLMDNLDESTKASLVDQIKRLTQGRADSVEGLFKLLASSHASDKKVAAEASAQLAAIRDSMNTQGGIPPLVKQLLALT